VVEVHDVGRVGAPTVGTRLVLQLGEELQQLLAPSLYCVDDLLTTSGVLLVGPLVELPEAL
jgi:hypothetical protein